MYDIRIGLYLNVLFLNELWQEKWLIGDCWEKWNKPLIVSEAKFDQRKWFFLYGGIRKEFSHMSSFLKTKELIQTITTSN